MGDPETAGQDVVPEWAGLDRDTGIALLERAAGIGLLESLGSGYYRIHPALPWYFTTLFAASYGQPEALAAQRAARAYARAIGEFGHHYVDQAEEGQVAQVVPVLEAEEGNLRHALDLARDAGLWRAATGCVQGLRVLYQRTGRDGEWARLVAAVTPDLTNPATGGPLPGREREWSLITDCRVRLARQARDWPTATALQNTLIALLRGQAAAALAAPPASLTPAQRAQIFNLGAALTELGNVLLQQEDPGCLPLFREALALDQRIGDRLAESVDAGELGMAYILVPGLRDLGQAEQWLQHSLSLRPDSDQAGRAHSHNQLGMAALARFDDARAAGKRQKVLLKHLNSAFGHYRQALDLLPADDHQNRADVENQLGSIFAHAGDTGQALRHYQQSIHHEEARGNIFGAGTTRFNIALLLARDGRTGDALHYAQAALDNYQQAGTGAASDADDARQLIAALERRSR
jgi:tetratricopeptide (TPR) repeat protein